MASPSPSVNSRRPTTPPYSVPFPLDDLPIPPKRWVVDTSRPPLPEVSEKVEIRRGKGKRKGKGKARYMPPRESSPHPASDSVEQREPQDAPVLVGTARVSRATQDSAGRSLESAGSMTSKMRREMERKAELEADEYTDDVTPVSVRCLACGRQISLDKRSKYYPGLWVKHRRLCRWISLMESEKQDKRGKQGPEYSADVGRAQSVPATAYSGAVAGTKCPTRQPREEAVPKVCEVQDKKSEYWERYKRRERALEVALVERRRSL